MKNTNNQKIIIPFWGGCLYPFQNIKNNFIKFLKLTSLFSLITTILSFVLGRSFACSINLDTIFCSFSHINSISSIVITIACLSLYVNRWNTTSTQDIAIKKTFSKPYLKKDLRALFIIFINILAFSTMGGSIYLLNQRKVTPNFNLELGLFILFSFLIILSLIILVNNVLLLRFLNSKKFLNLNKIFWPTFDNIYKYISWFIIFFILFAVILKNIFFSILSSGGAILHIILGEFFINFTLYTIMSFWISNLQYQEKYLFKEDK